MSSDTKPLVSFILLSYNQESFIQDGIDGAFSQTYSPLEIIISDDCSQDRSFEIIEAAAANYCGAHTLRIIRQPRNLGMGEHLNRVVGMARGELIVMAAGDDISLPRRTEVLVDAWDYSNRCATSIFSSFITLWSDGTLGSAVCKSPEVVGRSNLDVPYFLLTGDLLPFLSTKEPSVYGCTHAWTPAIFSEFGPLRSNLEDLVLSFRSLAAGQIVFVREPLVKYRRHGLNVSFMTGAAESQTFERRESRLRWVNESNVTAYDNIIADVELLCRLGRLRQKDGELLKAESWRIRSHYDTESKLMISSFSRRIGIVRDVVRKRSVREAIRFLPRTLPKAAYRLLYNIRERIRA